MNIYSTSALGPGALEALEKKITDPTLPPSQRIDTDKLIIDLTINDWAVLLKAFHEWPFAPQVKFSIISHTPN